MRRRVAGRTIAAGAQGRVDHCRDRPFAVGSGDMDAAERALRMIEPRGNRAHVVEPEFDAELFEAEQVGKRIHSTGAETASGRRAADGAGARTAPANRSALEIVDFNSRRSTTRSIIPF